MTTLQFDQCRVLLFAKEPQAGRVKTRMHPVLNDAQCMQLHRTLCTHISEKLANWQLCPTQLHFDISVEAQEMTPVFLAQLCQRLNFDLQPQVVGDLGDKMSAAVQRAFQEEVQGVILLGADCPFLTREHLQKLLQSLADGHNAAIIPAFDGGYVALALRHHEGSVFTAVDWGSDQVFSQTLSNFDALRWRYESLPALADIDRPDDLQLLQHSDNTALKVLGQLSLGAKV